MSGAPFVRFVVAADGRLQPVDGVWGYLPAVAALAHVTVDEAAAKIQAAVAEAPLPTRTPLPAP